MMYSVYICMYQGFLVFLAFRTVKHFCKNIQYFTGNLDANMLLYFAIAEIGYCKNTVT